MARVLQTIVLWLVTLAIPAQGMAAVAMSACVSGHHGAQTPAVEVHASGHAMHAGGEVRIGAPVQAPSPLAHDHHAPGGALHDSAGPAVQGLADDAGDAVGHDMLKCCSACTMAALTTQTTLASPQVHAVAPLHPLSSRYRGVTLAGPERPPKAPLD